MDRAFLQLLIAAVIQFMSYLAYVHGDRDEIYLQMTREALSYPIMDRVVINYKKKRGGTASQRFDV